MNWFRPRPSCLLIASFVVALCGCGDSSESASKPLPPDSEELQAENLELAKSSANAGTSESESADNSITHEVAATTEDEEDSTALVSEQNAEMPAADVPPESDDLVDPSAKLSANEDMSSEDAEIPSPPEPLPPAFRLLLPTTSGPVLVDVDLRIGDKPLIEVFDQRIGAVMDEARGSDDLTWAALFEHISSDREQFGGAPINAQQYRNLIRLWDKNRNKRPDRDEVAKFVFRSTRTNVPFRMVGSDYYRELNRTQSAVFSAIDSNGDRRLDDAEIDAASQSLAALDRNGDSRIESGEVVQTVTNRNNMNNNDDPAWNNRRISRWGEVAMDLYGYVDWNMMSYTLDESSRRGFGQNKSLFAELDDDGDGTVSSMEARALKTIQPDARLLIRFSDAATGEPASIELVSVSDELEPIVKTTSSPGRVTISGDPLRLMATVVDNRTGRNQIPPAAFAMLDANNNGGLEESEIPAVALREYSFEDLDRDEDGKLTLQEINLGMSPKSPIWDVQIRARGAETPDGVFTWLDENQDQVLSTREINGIAERLKSLSSGENGLVATDIPDSFLIQFGRGDPNQDLQLFSMRPPTTPSTGNNSEASTRPRWAQSMDTNRDGDISFEEFIGTRSQFDQLDDNGDGFIEASELQ